MHWMLFAAATDGEGFFWTALITAIGGTAITALAKIESLYKVINDIRMAWFDRTTTRDDAIIRRLETHLDKCDKELDIVKADHTKLSDDYNDILLELEANHWWMSMSYKVSMKNASMLRTLGATPEDPPEVPQRKVRKKHDSDFKDRTEKTGDSLKGIAAKEIMKKVEGESAGGGT